MDQLNNTTKAVKDSIKVIDTTAIISDAKTVIVVHEKAKDQVPKETDWTISLFIPIIIALVGTGISYLINKIKTDAEVNKLKADTNKTDVEIQKLIIENEKLKKSFQPIVIATLQSIQDKIVPFKIEALKSLVQLKNDFSYYDQQYCEGDPVTPSFDEFLHLIFFNFGPTKYNDFKKFHDEYSYLFPKNVFEKLEQLQDKLSNLNENKKSFMSYYDGELEPSGADLDKVKSIIDLFETIILDIRKDCHLDTSFIHDFIEQNK